MKTKLKELRTMAGLTQQQLADLVHVSARTIGSGRSDQDKSRLLFRYTVFQIGEQVTEFFLPLHPHRTYPVPGHPPSADNREIKSVLGKGYGTGRLSKRHVAVMMQHADGKGQADHSALVKYYEKLSGVSVSGKE